MATSTNVTTPPTPTSVTMQPSPTISESDDLILHPQGPQRPGKPVCPLYKNNRRCGHRAVCVFHHPAELPPLEEPKKWKRREKKPKSLNYRTFTREEHLAYLKRIKETDGFHVGRAPPGIRLAGELCPIPLSQCGSIEKDVAKLAIKCYNDDHGTTYKFIKLIRVNIVSVGGVRYYMTFQAKDGKPGSHPQNFQTRVYKCIGKTEVHFCRLEQKKSTLPEGSGEPSQQQGQ